jgi:hypothetical protein
LNVLDKDWVQAHARVFDEDKSFSREIRLRDWQNRPFPQKLRGCLGSILRQQM